MRHAACFLLAGLCAGALILSAQTTYTDNFSTNSGYWEIDVTATGGAFSRNGALNFTDSGLTTGQTSHAYRDLSFTAGAGADWQIQVDCTLALPSQAAGQITLWSLYASALTSATPDDYVVLELNQNYMQSGFRILNSTQYTNGTAVDSANLGSLTANTIALQIAYNAAAGTLALGYDADGATGGYGFTTLDTVSTATWLLSSGDEFGFRLKGSNTANASGTAAIGVGESYADNFSLAIAAIPEPAATAAFIGTLVLLIALRRRAV